MATGYKTASRRSSRKPRKRVIHRKKRRDGFLHRGVQFVRELPRRIFRAIFSRPVAGFVASMGLTLMLFGMIALTYYATMLPDISGLAASKEQPGVEVFAEDGSVLARYGQITGEYIPYHKLPIHLVNAVLATEDRRFFSHFGVDPRGILRAAVVNVQSGRFVQGGSTITQQLAKNVFLTPERTLSRKIQELMMAFWLEQTFSKEEILAIYLNRVYMGGGSYGVDSASRYYFDKSVAELDLVECAMLAGLLKAPSRYNPTASSKLAIQRTTQVLLNMVAAEKLSEDEAERAITKLKNGKHYLKEQAYGSERYFADWVIDQLPDYIGHVNEDVVVTTTLDGAYQKKAQAAVEQHLDEKTREERRVSQVALLAMRPDGAVVSMIGGRNYNDSQYNRAIQAKRQPGSAFKLFVYLTAMEQGYTPDMLMVDEPVQVGKWRPGNYDGKHRGAITLREALAQSVNTIAVKLSQYSGISAISNTARRLGIQSDMPDMPSMALGAMEVSLKELVTAYAHLAYQGRAVRPYGIIEVRRKRDKEVLYARSDRDDFSNVIVVNEQNVAKMNAMLSAVVEQGTARNAAIGRPAAGKTGTTSNYKDAWFIGYTPQLVTGVWVGNDDATATKRVTGGSLPAQIWGAYMKEALAGAPTQGLPAAYVPEATDAPLPWQEPLRGGGDGYQLQPSFWDTLFGDEQVEYEYPNQ